MGQRIDPRILRLGISVKWKLKIKEELITNIFINRLINWLMKSESIPTDDYANWQDEETTKFDVENWKQYHDSYYMHLPWNPFKYQGFVFSHSNFSIFNNTFYIAIFYFDTFAENMRLMENQKFNFFYFLTHNIYKKKKYLATEAIRRSNSLTHKISKKNINIYNKNRTLKKVKTLQSSSIINFKLFSNRKISKKKRLQYLNNLLPTRRNKPIVFKKKIFKKIYKLLKLKWKSKNKLKWKSKNKWLHYNFRIYGYGYDPSYKRKKLIKKYLSEYSVIQRKLFFSYRLEQDKKDMLLDSENIVGNKIVFLETQENFKKKTINLRFKKNKKKPKKIKERNMIVRYIYKRKIFKKKRKKNFLRAFLKKYRKNKLRYNQKKLNQKKKYFKRYNNIKDNYASIYIKKIAYGYNSSFYTGNNKIKEIHANLLLKEKFRNKKKLRKLKSYLFNISLSRILFKAKIDSFQDFYNYLIMLKPNVRLLRFFKKHIRHALLNKQKKNKFLKNWKIKKKEKILTTDARNYSKLKVFSRIIFQLKMKRIHNNVMKNIKLLKYLFRFFNHFKKMIKKEIIFFNSLLICSIFSLITLLPKNRVITKKLLLFLHYVYLYNFRLKYVYHRFNKVIFQERFLMLKTMSFLFSETIGRLYHSSRFVLLKQSIIRFMALHNKNVNADFLVNYILAKLRQFFIIDDILQPLLSHIRRLTTVKSYRFIIAGRLTRKERAAYMLLSYGRMPPGTINMSIDYSIGWIALRFGMVSVRVFLLLKKQKPFYYYMEFKNKSLVY